MGKGEMIGHDPLAWIKEEGTERPAVTGAPVAAATTAVAEPSAEEQPAAEPVMASVADEVEVVAVESSPPTGSVIDSPATAAESHSGHLELGEQLVISTVREFRAGWMEQIEEGATSPVTLEGGAIKTIDTAGLQLVIALTRELSDNGVSWQWGEASESLKSSAEQLGLTAALSLPA